MTQVQSYSEVVQEVERMISADRPPVALAKQHGLQVLNVTWEDTARFDSSAVGPNISDMTIQVQHQLPDRDDFQLTCMPVIRYPNFSDVTGDISPDDFYVLVGNECGEPLEKVTLRELLGNLRNGTCMIGTSWKGDKTSLLAERSRQSCAGQRPSVFSADPAGRRGRIQSGAV